MILRNSSACTILLILTLTQRLQIDPNLYIYSKTLLIFVSYLLYTYIIRIVFLISNNNTFGSFFFQSALYSKLTEVIISTYIYFKSKFLINIEG